MKRRAFLLGGLGGLLTTGNAFAAKKKAAAKSSGGGKSSTGKSASARGSAGGKGSKNGKGSKHGRGGRHASYAVDNGPVPVRVPARIAPEVALSGGVWRPYEVQIEVAGSSSYGDRATLWIPIPMDSPWQQVTALSWAGGGRAGIRFDPASQLHAYAVEADQAMADTRLTLRLETRDRQLDVTKRGTFFHESPEELERNVRESGFQGSSTSLRALADDICGRILEPLPRARAIYDWLLDRALNGQCAAYSNALPPGMACASPRGEDICIAFVNLCRALSIPARAVWGQVIGESRLHPALGARGDVSQDQRIRAEFHTPGYGWTPVDPGAVLRLQQLGGLRGADDPTLLALRKKFFGYWEMNWVAYNYGPGFKLPGGIESNLAGLATPIVTVNGSRSGRIADGSVRYRIEAKAL